MLSLTKERVRIIRHKMKTKMLNIAGVILAILLFLLILVLARCMDTLQKEENMRPKAQNTEDSALIQSSQAWEMDERSDTATQADEESESSQDILQDPSDENSEAYEEIAEESLDSIPDRNETGESASETMEHESGMVEESVLTESSIPKESDSEDNVEEEDSSTIQNWGEEDWE